MRQTMSDSLILSIETSTEACSAAVSDGSIVMAEKHIDEPRHHASLLAPFIQEVLEKAGVTLEECAAVAVSKGPGSYTGLRVGVSTAKGLCFGAGKPLIAVGTLQILASSSEGKADFIVPMIDARRMEVYCAVYDKEGKPLTEIEPLILDENSFSDYLERGTVLFTGDGAEKFRSLISHPNAIFDPRCPMAKDMAKPAFEALKRGNFENVAYFEPFYLKEFVAGVSKKNILGI